MFRAGSGRDLSHKNKHIQYSQIQADKTALKCINSYDVDQLHEMRSSTISSAFLRVFSFLFGISDTLNYKEGSFSHTHNQYVIGVRI